MSARVSNPTLAELEAKANAKERELANTQSELAELRAAIAYVKNLSR